MRETGLVTFLSGAVLLGVGCAGGCDRCEPTEATTTVAPLRTDAGVEESCETTCRAEGGSCQGEVRVDGGRAFNCAITLYCI